MLAEVNDQNGGGRLPQKGRGHAIAAGILGWTLDTFDFFVVVSWLICRSHGPQDLSRFSKYRAPHYAEWRGLSGDVL